MRGVFEQCVISGYALSPRAQLPSGLGPDGERGSVSPIALGFACLASALALGVLVASGVVVARARAEAAADAAALAAALEAARGGGKPEAAAEEFALANGGRLVICSCPPGGLEHVVEVEVEGWGGRRVRARARAVLSPP